MTVPRIVLIAAALAGGVGLTALTAPEVKSQAPPARPREPLVNLVKQSIERGVQFLRDQERGQGHWENIPDLIFQFPMKGGPTALALLALLNSGVKPDDPIIERGLKYLNGLENERTYVVALSTMVFEAAGRDADRIRMQKNVDWLVQARVKEDGRLLGWTYAKGQVHAPDNSNTQYALLGLHAGKEAGLKIPDEIWSEIRDFYMSTQSADGGWGYRRNNGSILTMTCAGLTGMYIAGMELSSRQACGQYRDNDTLKRAENWIVNHFRFEDFDSTGKPYAGFYNVYGIERVGRLSGQRFLGNHDWYREGCQVLVGEGPLRKNHPFAQKDDGSWVGPGAMDRWKTVSTSFALLFLSRGRTPVLISKLKHGRDDDWNNDRHDARNLVRYARKELFKNQPLGWQIFAPAQSAIENENDLLDVTSELLQSPILYLNGHNAPALSNNEIQLVQRYVENGGFILAEACCGRDEFDKGFRDLIKKIFPDNELQPLAPEHPVWRAFHSISDFTTYPLEGIQQGCKTVLIYSRKDMSCTWELGKFEDPNTDPLAFRLAGNIIAYATGLELPRPRLTPMEVLRDHADPREVPRNFFQVAQLRHQGDWQPAPRAMRNLVSHLRDTAGIDVVQKTEALSPQHPDLKNFKFLYMHGRNAFTYSAQEIKNLRAALETGGLLLADSCCGRKPFNDSFRAMANKLFPDAKLERIPLTDELFGKDLNGGQAIRLVKARREAPSGQGADSEARDGPPFLEGIKHKGRWVVIYSKYDLGCALEKHQSPECLGHDHASALKLASAAVLYAMMR